MKKKTPETITPIEPEVQQTEDVVVEGNLTVGQILKKARKEKGEKIDKIANQLRIRAYYLSALEESQYDVFPGQAYAFGFLRGYAQFLGLDVDKLVGQYRQETSFIKPEEIDMPIKEEHSMFPSIKYIICAIVLIFVVWVFWYFLTYKETQVETVQEIIASQEPVIAEEVVAEKVVFPPVEEEKKVVPDVKASQNSKTKKSAVQIVAREEVWVEIEQDGDLILNRTLKKGEKYDVPESKEEMFLKTGNAGGLDVFVDGKKVKALGPVGAVRSGISLSAEKLKKR